MNQLQAVKHPESEFVFIKKNQVFTDSLTVASMFGKNHADVLRDIRKQMEYAGYEFSLSNFAERTYESRGRYYPKIDMTEEAFTLVVFGYNTKEAVQIKIKFIQEFKRMKEYIQKQQQPSIEDSIIYSMTELKRVKERQQQVEEDMNKMKFLIDNEVWLTEQNKEALSRKVKRRVFELKEEGYSNASYQAVYGALKKHFGVAKYDKIPRKYYQNAMKFVSGWYPPERPLEGAM
ncbi:Rha family transcriptional regulator [Bacillus cereus group sp. TH228LC]|uniref:Rha family transcriptional regulator n=1 Tax=Bacillus cereus group sp. TH228LC TaxID=3018049 RepID=UPI0022E7D861|nr:Rha family transcriptional regulator [Bacillus cereus group sp. TH228LC]MDA1581914.1 ORF6C domain-containing protein [Bacillus cereus group sp. TH228LC]